MQSSPVTLPAYPISRLKVVPESNGTPDLETVRWWYRVPPLLVILTVQAGLSLRLIWSNTAFMDEGLYLWAGKLEWAHWLHGADVASYAFPSYFSGAPVIYPPLGALASDAGGLAGARVLSLCFMLGATALLYSVTQRLTFNRRAATAAAVVFAFLGPTQFLGAFATYDAMALFLLALASWLAVRSNGRWGELALIASALVMVLANATKYASLLWDPVVIALAVLGPPILRPGSTALKAAGRGIRLVIYVAATIAVVLKVAGHSYVKGLMYTTLSRQIPGHYAPHTVLNAAYDWIGIVFVLALLGFILSFRTGHKRAYWLCGILTAAVLLAPVNQARIDTLTSLQKHVAFGAWFAAIAAGYGLSRVADMTKANFLRLTAVIAAIIIWFGYQQGTFMFTWWPNASGMTRELSIALSRSKCPCLIAENNVASYYLPQLSGVPVGSYGFSYHDKYAPGGELGGIYAYRQAIKDGYFGVIELDGAESTSTWTPLTRTLAGSREYTLLATVPASNQAHPFKIWVRR